MDARGILLEKSSPPISKHKTESIKLVWPPEPADKGVLNRLITIVIPVWELLRKQLFLFLLRLLFRICR